MPSKQTLSALLLATATLGSCSKSDDEKGTSANIPMLTPPVRAASPAGLSTAAAALSGSGLFELFFAPEGGPTNLFNILTTIDGRSTGINGTTANDETACVSQAVVSYTINPLGVPVEFFGQCVENLPAGPVSTTAGFFQYGVNEGKTYIYSFIGDGQLAAIISPITGSDGKYEVEAWISVGAGNTPFDNGSRALMHLSANSATNAFEFTVGGQAVGYCGASLKSDGTDLFARFSKDIATDCEATTEVCVKAADAVTPSTCSTALSTFGLDPLGRNAVTAGDGDKVASPYPIVPNVTFDGTANDAIYFGPITATPGLGSL